MKHEIKSILKQILYAVICITACIATYFIGYAIYITKNSDTTNMWYGLGLILSSFTSLLLVSPIVMGVLSAIFSYFLEKRKVFTGILLFAVFVYLFYFFVYFREVALLALILPIGFVVGLSIGGNMRKKRKASKAEITNE